MTLVPHVWRSEGSVPWSWSSPGPIGDRSGAPQLLLIHREDPVVRRSIPALRALLSDGERQYLERLREHDDRERFLLGRGVLRLELGRLLERDPGRLVFARGAHGKLALEDTSACPGTSAPQPNFNVSHSGDLILLAFHPARPVGVDVEQECADLDWQPIAARYLTPEETNRISVLPASRRPAAFLEVWCRLEAGLKARGVGLFGLERTLGAEDPGSAPDLWPVAVPDGYHAAAAAIIIDRYDKV